MAPPPTSAGRDPATLTLGELLALLARLPLRTAWSLAGMALGLASLLVVAGLLLQTRSTAVFIERPFGMRIQGAGLDHEFPFGSLIVTQGYHTHTSDQRLVLQLRRKPSREAIGYEQIGEIEVSPPRSRGLLEALARRAADGATTPQAHAGPPGFDLGRYRDDLQFRERFVAPDTIERIYDRGAVLRYRIDGRGRAVPGSYRWVRP